NPSGRLCAHAIEGFSPGFTASSEGIDVYVRGDSGQVARALRVWDALRGFKGGRWVTEIAEQLGVSERTVRRDIIELQDAGIDIEVTKRANRVYARLTEERNYSPVSITKRERFTLLAVRRVFDVFAKTPFLEDVQSVLAKLEQRMSEKERAELAAFGEQFVYMPDHGTKSYEGKDEIIDAIQDSIIKRKVLRYRYRDTRGRSRSGFLAPFRLAMYRHGLYCVGAQLKSADSEARDARLGVFAIERFTEAEHLKQHDFEIPMDAPVREILTGAFGPHLRDDNGPHDVVVEFSASKAQLVSSREWHPEQTVSTLPEGASGCRSARPASRLSCLGSSNGDRTRARLHRTRLSNRSRASSLRRTRSTSITLEDGDVENRANQREGCLRRNDPRS
ncbi:MAG TPA: WYL domain-containing protein, partial [Gemmatimonadaceae bacterium]